MGRFPAWIGRWRAWSEQPGPRRWLILLGALLFIVTLVVAVGNLPDRPESTRWGLLAWVLVVLAPASMVLSAVEYRLTGAVAGRHVGSREALRVSVMSSLANLLPLPGSYIVRAGHLSAQGVSAGRAATAPSALALAWVGVSGVAAGALLAAGSERMAWSVGLVSGGLLALAGSFAVLLALTGKSAPRWMGPVVMVELGSVAISAIRYYLVLAALGFDATWEAAALLALASVLGVAAGIVPGGLGIREVLAGGFVLLTGLEAAVGVLAAAFNRIIGLVALGTIGAIVFVGSRSQSEIVTQDTLDGSSE